MRDLGSLKNCLMEGEEGAGLRSPRRRRIALVLSICLQILVLAALLLAPLLVKGERLKTRWDEPPTPIYVTRERVPPQDPRPVSGPTKRGPRPHVGTTFYAPTSFPDRAPILHDADERVPEVGFTGAEFVGTVPVPGGDSSRGWRPPVPEPPRPEPAESPRRLRISDMNFAKLIHRVEPVYPRLAVQTRTQGTVVLRALIGTDGAVRELQVVSGHPLLLQAALDAVAQWRYQPTLLNGQPVEVETRITVIFILNR